MGESTAIIMQEEYPMSVEDEEEEDETIQVEEEEEESDLFSQASPAYYDYLDKDKIHSPQQLEEGFDAYTTQASAEEQQSLDYSVEEGEIQEEPESEDEEGE